ncbi:hypothetical protein [Nodosilinea sp. P-1105]|uniref:hypothetical protein n=1 Tax=Nodosilinea sp. P-1105 TaxID=2546229 RepID=UPI00146A25A9|nr:hypothetical protein [Nodosilinea sp. P-1105]NMF83362.1 hypothetical protein [Nodosilinea sp. P-1105]
MTLVDLSPALRELSRVEKLQAMQFLLAEISQAEAGVASELIVDHPVEPKLCRKGGVLVIETGPLDEPALADLVSQTREERLQKLLSL